MHGSRIPKLFVSYNEVMFSDQSHFIHFLLDWSYFQLDFAVQFDWLFHDLEMLEIYWVSHWKRTNFGWRRRIHCKKTVSHRFEKITDKRISFIIFRDNGIVIETSKLQLALEVIFSLSVHTAYFVIPRSYFVFDRFISLTIFIVPFVVQPLFFFVGDLRFRTRVQNRGLMKAIKMEILDQ